MQIQLSIFICTALKIHVSPATKSVLDQFSSFILETRGETEMKVRSLAILSLASLNVKNTHNMASNTIM